MSAVDQTLPLEMLEAVTETPEEARLLHWRMMVNRQMDARRGA